MEIKDKTSMRGFELWDMVRNGDISWDIKDSDFMVDEVVFFKEFDVNGVPILIQHYFMKEDAEREDLGGLDWRNPVFTNQDDGRVFDLYDSFEIPLIS